MAYRISSPTHPVTFTHDGASVVAERGEALALALLAADRGPLSRSGKLHRPRSAWCLRGACEGCLARVDGVPNVMTCRRAARGGEVVETQNVMGSRHLDVLRATDFLFPNGIDHHHLLAGVSGVSQLVQGLARRIAGLGRLPDEQRPAREARRRELDVLVVGAGAAGLAAAAMLGERALVVDDDLAPGGTLAWIDPPAAAALVERARQSGASIESETTALALFREPPDPAGRLRATLIGPAGATLVVARAVIVAAGAHDTPLAFGDNDLPGVMSARAGLRLWQSGIAPAERVVIAGVGSAGDAFERRAASTLHVTRVDAHSLLRVTGRARVRAVVVRDGQRERRLAAGALLVDGPRAPSFELAVQAGADARFDAARGFTPVLDGDGLAAPGVWCAGEMAGPARGSAEDGERVARAVAAALVADH